MQALPGPLQGRGLFLPVPSGSFKALWWGLPDQVRQRGGPRRRAALPQEVGLPALRGHLLDQDQRGRLAEAGRAAGRARRAAAHQGAWNRCFSFFFSCFFLPFFFRSSRKLAARQDAHAALQHTKVPKAAVTCKLLPGTSMGKALLQAAQAAKAGTSPTVMWWWACLVTRHARHRAACHRRLHVATQTRQKRQAA
jgi:hypothetical protein